MATVTQREPFCSDLLLGKSAFVAGGTSGINLIVAKRFQQLGANVAVISRNQEKVTAAIQTIAAAGGPGKVLGWSADVREDNAVDDAMGKAALELGALDVIVAGAAGNFVAFARDLSPKGFKTVVDVDLFGAFHVYHAAYKHLRKPGASLISISASQAHHPFWAQSHVCAAKSGVEMLTRTLALEWGPEGVRANSICPGPIEDTEGMRRLAPTPQIGDAIARTLPLRRFGRASEVADMAVFLASDAANYVTGATLYCDGGQNLVGSGALGAIFGGAQARQNERD